MTFLIIAPYKYSYLLTYLLIIMCNKNKMCQIKVLYIGVAHLLTR